VVDVLDDQVELAGVAIEDVAILRAIQFGRFGCFSPFVFRAYAWPYALPSRLRGFEALVSTDAAVTA